MDGHGVDSVRAGGWGHPGAGHAAHPGATPTIPDAPLWGTPPHPHPGPPTRLVRQGWAGGIVGDEAQCRCDRDGR
jgi:hypothetical protein